MTRTRGVQPTVRDIAAETGVSIATVSRVLNNRDNVAAATRNLVLRAAERLGASSPSLVGTAVRRGDTGAIFVRCPYLLTDYFGLIVSSIAETCDLYGRRLVLNAGAAAARATVLDDLADQRGIAGAILILPPESDDHLVALAARGFPLVVVDPRSQPPRDVVAVSAAHFAGARRLTAHLVGLGHRRIGVIGGPVEWLASDARLAGHAAALADVGVLPSQALLRSVQPTMEYGYRAASDLLNLPDLPTALVCFNDKVAVGALRAAVERGLRVPADVSIAGFDDLDLSRATSPLLTTVRQPLLELGRMAVTMLIRLIERHQLDALHVELATELIIRDSTGPNSGTGA